MRGQKGKIFLIVVVLIVGFCVAVGNKKASGGHKMAQKMETDVNKEKYFSENKNLGSAGELAGTTIVMSIFVDDKNTKWDFERKEDVETAETIHHNLAVSTDWIAKQGEKYGEKLTFIYDFTKEEKLLDFCAFSTEMVTDKHWKNADQNVQKYIDKELKKRVSGLKKKYQADNVVYMLYLNTDYENRNTSSTISYYEDAEYPYEICYMRMKCEDEYENPAGFSHEILHTFGAVDLYMADSDYGISREYVQHCKKTKSNDIMYTTFGAKNNKSYKNKVTNQITDVTAYYLGWRSSSRTVNKWNLGSSEHANGN